jgi:hypothetical protein
LLEESFDPNLDSDFRVVLKKLSKKDNLTKLKALDELKNLIEIKSVEECVLILPYWTKTYTKLVLDMNRKIREQCQLNHEKIVFKVNKNIASYLKTLVPYWILAQSDSYMPTSRLAESSFQNTFNDNKRPEVVYFAREEIINVCINFFVFSFKYKCINLFLGFI